MSFPYSYSKTAQNMRPSPIRELFKLIQKPGMISFAGGLPDPAIFPVQQFAQCAPVLGELGTTALQYGATEGYAPLLELLRARMEKPLGRPVAADEIMIGSGSQQVMDMLSRVLIDPGDVVVTEAPTYPGALHTFRNQGARFATVPCDAQGMQVERLPEIIETCRKETGRLPKLIYSIVNFSNPSGACLSSQRRPKLVEIGRHYGVPVLEDDPYGELRYKGEPPATVFSHGREGILYASSFSKILAPGVRVAWVVGDRDIIRKMVIAKQGMDLCTSVVAQVLVAEYCKRGHLDGHLGRIREHYAAKASAMASALERILPQGTATWVNPEGGFFFWLELKSDARALFVKAADKGVAFLPGDTCFPSPDETIGPPVDGSRFARLCFTFAQPSEIDEGMKRLASALG